MSHPQRDEKARDRVARLVSVTRGPVVSAAGKIAALAAIAVLQAYWYLQPVPIPAKAVAALVLLVSIVRPASGLLVFAGLSPLSTALAAVTGGATGLGGQLLEQMALSIGAGVILRGGTPASRPRLGAPALFMGVVAVASAAAMIPAAAAPFARVFWDGQLLQELTVRNTAMNSPVWVPLFAGLVTAECALLGWAAERTVRQSPGLATRLVAMALIGHAGAAILNLQALLGGALRTGDALQALPRLLMTTRISLQTDWNAAASALVLAGVAGAGLLAKPWSRKAGVGVLLLIIAAAVWTSGSRIAFAMGAFAIVAAIGWWAVHAGWRARLVVAGVVILTLGAGTWLIVANPAGRNYPISNSITGRLQMAKTGVQLFKTAPVFGIGITKFFAASAAHDDPFRRTFVGGVRENAHNNFVQVLAELGLVGLGALLWWLGAVLVGAARAQMLTPHAVRRALILAILACIGTWLTGHPLLVPEFAFVFFLFCGILAALTPAVPAIRTRWLVWVLVAGVVVSVPLRASVLRDNVELEHRGLGVSPLWQHDDTERYREAGGSFALYLPATGQPVGVPLRLAPGAPGPLVVDVRIQGRLTDRISIDGEAWQTVIVTLRPGSRRFELVDFSVRPPASSTTTATVLLRVGKAVPR